MGTIHLDGIGRRFKDTTAVAEVDLDIDDGDFLVLLGPSGCGKTTLLRMIAGLLEPTSGRIEIDGEEVTDTPARKRDLAMVFQSYALYPHLSVHANLAFPLRMKRRSKSDINERVVEVATMLEIEHLLDRKPKELSGGQRQRVALGRALVRNPRAYLMDEPLSNLEAKLRTGTRQELTALHRRLGATFVYVTHDQVEAMTMATRIAVMNQGSIEQLAAPADIYDRPASVFVAGFVGSPAMNLCDGTVSRVRENIVVDADGMRGELWAGDTPMLDVTVGIRPEHLSISDGAPSSDSVVGDAVVEIVENLGNELIVACRVGTRRVQVRAARGLQVVVGDEVVLTAAPEHVHLFDRASGRRLQWVDDDASVEAGLDEVEPDLVLADA